MEEKKKEIVDKLIEDHKVVLKNQKKQLEEQITADTKKEQVLPEAFLEQRREKLADVIKQTKILETDETEQETDARDKRGLDG